MEMVPPYSFSKSDLNVLARMPRPTGGLIEIVFMIVRRVRYLGVCTPDPACQRSAPNRHKLLVEIASHQL